MSEPGDGGLRLRIVVNTECKYTGGIYATLSIVYYYSVSEHRVHGQTEGGQSGLSDHNETPRIGSSMAKMSTSVKQLRESVVYFSLHYEFMRARRDDCLERS